MPSEELLGLCPECEEQIVRGNVLIEYEADGEAAVFAECGACHAVISPKPIRVPALDPTSSSHP